MGKRKKFYLPMVVQKQIGVKVDGQEEVLLSCKDLADGCIGVIPVFRTKRDAKKLHDNVLTVERDDNNTFA